jgi:Kiwa protein KwaB-like
VTVADAAKALEELQALVAGEPRLQLATVARPARKDDPPDMRSVALADAAAQFFRRVVNRAVEGATASRLVAFDPVYKADSGQVEWLELAGVAAVELAVDRHRSSTAPFDARDDGYLRRLQYWTASLGGEAFFFRAFSAAAELGRKRGEALVLRGGTFRTLTERVFLFDENVDCVVYGGVIFVLRSRDYRRIFEQLDALRLEARTAAEEVEQRVPVVNADDFVAACSTDSRLAEKVLAVRKRPYYDQLSVALLEPVIRDFGLHVETVDDGGTRKLVFDARPERRFLILKLLDDDYLMSTMTERRYEVNSKLEHGS